jgi:hypothetical protein
MCSTVRCSHGHHKSLHTHDEVIRCWYKLSHASPVACTWSAAAEHAPLTRSTAESHGNLVRARGSHWDCSCRGIAPAGAAGGPQLCRQLTSTSEGIRSCHLLCCALAAKRARPRKQERHPACYSSLLFDHHRSGCNVSIVRYRCQRGSLVIFALSAISHATCEHN